MSSSSIGPSDGSPFSMSDDVDMVAARRVGSGECSAAQRPPDAIDDNEGLISPVAVSNWRDKPPLSRLPVKVLLT